MMSKNIEYYPSVIVIRDMDPYAFRTSQDVFRVLKQMRIGIVSYIEMQYEDTPQRERIPYAVVHFERWNTAMTREMRNYFENGKSIDIIAFGQRAYMVDYIQRNFLQKQKEDEERRIRRQREEEARRLRKQEEEARRLRKQREEERRLRKQRQDEEERRNREAAEKFEMENQYINDMPLFNDLEIDYGDEETQFFKFNRKTGNMDYKGRQYIVYV